MQCLETIVCRRHCHHPHPKPALATTSRDRSRRFPLLSHHPMAAPASQCCPEVAGRKISGHVCNKIIWDEKCREKNDNGKGTIKNSQRPVLAIVHLIHVVTTSGAIVDLAETASRARDVIHALHLFSSTNTISLRCLGPPILQLTTITCPQPTPPRVPSSPHLPKIRSPCAWRGRFGRKSILLCSGVQTSERYLHRRSASRAHAP